MDYCPAGELFELLKVNRHMPEDKARFYVVETLLALRWPASAMSRRQVSSCSCRLIFTGQTSVHDAQRLQANGSVEYFLESVAGLRIEPIGPGTVAP